MDWNNLGLVKDIFTEKAPVIGLATGNTMVPIYEYLKKALKGHRYVGAKFFVIDEYWGMDGTDPRSFHYYIRENFLKHIEGNYEFIAPNFKLADEKIISQFKTRINELSIDLILLGIGENGHIAFNEPGTHKGSQARKVKLDDSTTKKIPWANQDVFAITLGISEILSADKIFLFANGESKRDAIKMMYERVDSSDCPASYLTSHSGFKVFLKNLKL